MDVSAMFGDKPTIKSEAAKKLIRERRERQRVQEEEAAKPSAFASMFGSSASEPPAPAPITVPSAPAGEDDASFSARLSSAWTATVGGASQSTGLSLWSGPGGDVENAAADDDDYSDVFYANRPREPVVQEYTWWDRAQARYRILGGTQRMCGCSTRTCIIVTVVIVVFILLLLLVVAWANKGSFMFI